jgi:hypothetical protein
MRSVPAAAPKPTTAPKTAARSKATIAPSKASAAANPANAVTAGPVAAAVSPGRRPRGQINSAWVLSVMLLAVCLASVGWLFAHGTAATFWLVVLVAVGFAGVPIGLLTLRLFGYDDVD